MIETTAIIEAPLVHVHKILLDFPKYPDWNPFIVKVEGVPEPKDQIHVDIMPPGDSSPSHFDPIVLVNSPNEFRWLGMLCCSCCFTGEHYFLLRELTPARTEFVHGEVFHGCLNPLFFCLMETKTRRGF
jgi:hypothetical protein